MEIILVRHSEPIANKNCYICGKIMLLCVENYLYTASGLSNVTLKNVSIRRCLSCDNHEVILPHISELHQVIAKNLLRDPVRLDNTEIRFLQNFFHQKEEGDLVWK